MAIVSHTPIYVCGYKLPSLRLVHHGDIHRLDSPDHLLIQLTEEDTDSLTLGQFFRKVDERIECCERCLASNRSCALYFKEVREASRPYPPQEGVVDEYEFDFYDRPAESLDRCPLVEYLLSLAHPKAEGQRRFLELYLARALPERERLRELTRYFNQPLAEGVHGRIDLPERLSLLKLALEDTMKQPALLPEVWLTYSFGGIARLAANDPLREYIEHHPSVVDFVMLWKGQRHVIEIDGPSHYSEERGGRLVPSEAKYTHNLKVDRGLRSEGWQVHRFSNLEVLSSDDLVYAVVDLGIASTREYEAWVGLAPGSL